jgi:(p)ppGpp synthase/HD superfamily hydrolase
MKTVRTGKPSARLEDSWQTDKMANIQRAIEIAVEAHKGQIDKQGVPYILHPLNVMGRVQRAVGPREPYLCVAVLHDVVEDCPGWYLSTLSQEGFSPEIVAAVDSVTKRSRESYPDFVRRSKFNTIGAVVKLADVIDNHNRLTRLYNARWVQKLNIKYNVALAILKDDHEWLQLNRELVAGLESA